MDEDSSFRHIAELGGGVAWILDLPSRRLRYLSPALRDLLGYAPEDVCATALPASLLEGLGERLRRFDAGDATRREVLREHELLASDGRLVPVLILSAITSPTTLVGSLRDHRPVRAQELEQKRFASMLNHEFRTPLATIDGAIQRLEATNKNADEPTRARYTKIAGAVDRLIGMLDQYLSPERIQSIGHKPRETGIAPQVLLDEAAQHARSAGRVVEQIVGALPSVLRCEPAGLRMVMKILVGNAIQYTPVAAVITLTAGMVNNELEILVADDGPGIAAHEVASVFDKNFRGQNAAGIPGNGLGLYMARSVVEVHGGSLSVSASAAGGACFRILLPAGKNLASHGNSVDNSYDQHVGVGVASFKDSK